VPNIDKGKLKTGMLIPHEYGRIEELKALLPGVIISVLGHPAAGADYVKVRLEHMLREAINTHALPLLDLHNH
jgi:hypothetical protein